MTTNLDQACLTDLRLFLPDKTDLRDDLAHADIVRNWREIEAWAQRLSARICDASCCCHVDTVYFAIADPRISGKVYSTATWTGVRSWASLVTTSASDIIIDIYHTGNLFDSFTLLAGQDTVGFDWTVPVTFLGPEIHYLQYAINAGDGDGEQLTIITYCNNDTDGYIPVGGA